MFAGERFPNEPEGAEAAIFWHLQQIDFHDNQASEADACDMAEAANGHDSIAKRHQRRLEWLENLFPVTARDARASLQRSYDERSNNISIKHPEEPAKSSDAIFFYIERVDVLQNTRESYRSSNFCQQTIKGYQDRLDQLETEFPAASVAARMAWRKRQDEYI